MKTQDLNDFAIEGAGGGGGCFIAGTNILTPEGSTFIEWISVGDEVMCYDEFNKGVLTVGTVTETFIHPKEDNICGLRTFTLAGMEDLTVTGNHYIQDKDGKFQYAANFEVGDLMIVANGTYAMIINIVDRDIDKDELVYNFKVTPHHTYIANGIRVHNGGGGDSKGGSSNPAVEAPNTLASSATALILEVISEGEIVGLVDGAKSIYFDGTAVQNADNTYNFQRFSFDQRLGLPSQAPMPGFPDVESEVNVSVAVTHAVSVARTVSNTTVDAVRVTMSLPAGLFSQDKSNGNVNGNSVEIAIDTRPAGGTWTQVFTEVITGKSMTPYEKAYRIERPNAGPGYWDVRLRRISADDVDSSVKSLTTFSHFTEIIDKKLPYNDTAYIGMKIDAKSTGGNVPRRSFRVKGIKCQVPVNYDPVTRVYTGVWNGTFKKAWTDNPIWVVYDLLTNTRYGLGSFIETSMVDKYSFYDAGRYNDELVSDGNGGTEPRFTFNAVINTRQDAWKLIQAVASTCRSVVFYGAGLIKVIQDRPAAVSLIVNKTDVANGVFEYASTSLQMRHPVVQVTFNEKAERYLPSTISVEDTDGINRYGYNVKEIVAYGATTSGQARRMGLWSLRTELETTESVKFVTGLNTVTRLQPGSVIKIVDEDLLGVPFGGRIVSSTTTSMVLDRSVTLLTGQTYTIEWLDVDGTTIISRPVTSSVGAHTTITWSTAAATAPYAGATWIITSNIIEGKLYRIYNVKELDGNAFEVNALAYDAARYTAVDSVTNPDLWTPINKVLNYCPSPTNVTWHRETETDSYGRKIVNLRINWDQTDSQYISNYQVRYKRNDAQVTNIMLASHREFVIPNVTEGDFTVYITAVNVSNVKSAVTIDTYANDLSGGVSGLFPVQYLQVKGGGTTWSGKDLAFTWQQNPANDNVGESVFKSYYIELRNPVGDVLIKTVEVTSPEYTYYFDDNKVENTTPLRSVKVNVFAKDSFNRLSTAITATLTNPVPATPTFTLANGYQYYTVSITPSGTDDDVAGFYVCEVATVGATPVIGDVKYKGASNKVDIANFTGNANVRVGTYDVFSDTFSNVLFATGQSIAVTQATEVIDSSEGYKFFSLTFKANDPTANNVSWTSSTVVKTNTGATQTCPSGSATWSGTAIYLFYDWTTNVISSTTTIGTAVGVGKALLGTYYGGLTLHNSGGDAYFDGNKIIAQTVGASQIVTGTAVITEGAQIASAIIGGSKLINGTITSTQIAADTITGGNIAANTITASELVTTSALITASAQIGTAVIGGSSLANGTITTTQIAADTITATNLVKTAALITANAQIGSAVIGGSNLANGTITTTQIAADTITANNLIKTAAIITDSAQIGTAVITTAKIGDLQVDTLKIANEAVTTTAVYDYTTPFTPTNKNQYYTFYTSPSFTPTSDKVMLGVNFIATWDDGIGSWANVADGYQTSEARVGFRVVDASDLSIDQTYQQTIGYAYVEGWWVTTKSGYTKFLQHEKSQRWENTFDKSLMFTAVPGKTYYIEAFCWKNGSGATIPGAVSVPVSPTLTVNEVVITRMVVKK